MKNFLLIVIMALLLMGCGRKNVEEGYADAGIARRGLQINIYEATFSADYVGFIEEESDSSVVEALRKEAEECDTLIVSCLVIEDTANDTVIDIIDIK